jgi:hypothetical protein
MSPEHPTPTTVETEARGVVLPPGVSAGEATVLLDAFARVKERRFGRLAVTVSDGRVVDVELIEKMDRNQLRLFA